MVPGGTIIGAQQVTSKEIKVFVQPPGRTDTVNISIAPEAGRGPVISGGSLEAIQSVTPTGELPRQVAFKLSELEAKREQEVKTGEILQERRASIFLRGQAAPPREKLITETLAERKEQPLLVFEKEEVPSVPARFERLIFKPVTRVFKKAGFTEETTKDIFRRNIRLFFPMATERAVETQAGAAFGVGKFIVKKPISTAAIIAAGFGVGGVTAGIATAFPKAQAAITVAELGAGGFFLGATALEVKEKKTPFEKGEVVGVRGLQAGLFGIGAIKGAQFGARKAFDFRNKLIGRAFVKQQTAKFLKSAKKPKLKKFPRLLREEPVLIPTKPRPRAEVTLRPAKRIKLTKKALTAKEVKALLKPLSKGPKIKKILRRPDIVREEVKVGRGQVQIQIQKQITKARVKTKQFLQFQITETKVTKIPKAKFNIKIPKAKIFQELPKVKPRIKFKQKQFQIQRLKQRTIVTGLAKQRFKEQEQLKAATKGRVRILTIPKAAVRERERVLLSLRELAKAKHKFRFRAELVEIQRARQKERAKIIILPKIISKVITLPPPLPPPSLPKLIKQPTVKIPKQPTPSRLRRDFFAPKIQLPKLKFFIQPSQRKQIGRQSFRFTPSLAAIELNIRGIQPKVLTGFGIRPLPPRKRKKRRKGRKR